MSGGSAVVRERVHASSTDLILGRAGRKPWLDVVRGVAVALVMLRHAWPSAFPAAGIVGVTMFFALSGYLITGLIVRDIRDHKHLRWGRFYAHRFLRLYPALILLVAVFSAVELIWDPIGSRSSLLASVAIALSYTADLPFAEVMSGSITHLWSLAVEEQFYLIWPAFLTLGVATLGHRGLLRWAIGAAAVLTAVCWALAIALPPASMYQLPTTWASAMVIGGAAFLARERLTSLARPAAAALGAALLAALCFVPDAKNLALTYFTLPTLVAVGTIAVIISMEERRLPAMRSAGGLLRLTASLGVISYAAYLWNLPIVVWWNQAVDLSGAADVLTIAVTIGMAGVSWYTVEAAGRALRSRYDAKASRLIDATKPAAGTDQGQRTTP